MIPNLQWARILLFCIIWSMIQAFDPLTYYPGQKIETTTRTWRRRVISRACMRLCLACVPVSIFLARVVLVRTYEIFQIPVTSKLRSHRLTAIRASFFWHGRSPGEGETFLHKSTAFLSLSGGAMFEKTYQFLSLDTKLTFDQCDLLVLMTPFWRNVGFVFDQFLLCSGVFFFFFQLRWAEESHPCVLQLAVANIQRDQSTVPQEEEHWSSTGRQRDAARSWTKARHREKRRRRKHTSGLRTVLFPIYQMQPSNRSANSWLDDRKWQEKWKIPITMMKDSWRLGKLTLFPPSKKKKKTTWMSSYGKKKVQN